MDNSVTIIIPARGDSADPDRHEKFLERTIRDVLEKAEGEVKVCPVIDGKYEIPEKEKVIDSRVHYLRLPIQPYTQKRHGINQVVAETDSKYVMSLDAHCMLDQGFDIKLKEPHEDNWVQIPRRNRLDAENWCIQKQSDDRPPIDYEYFMYPKGPGGDNGLHGFRWDERTYARWDIPIDDTLEFQASLWFMTKDYFNHLGLMQIEGYTGWGAEAEEIGFKTRRDGGRVITNKTTWYAHLHKGKVYGRMYYMSRNATRRCNEFAYNEWVFKNKETFIKSIDQFWPLPGWPENWKKEMYG